MGVLTSTHVLDIPCHAHDQASIWKAVDQLPSPALIFGGWYSRSDVSLFDCVRTQKNHFVSDEEKVGSGDVRASRSPRCVWDFEVG